MKIRNLIIALLCFGSLFATGIDDRNRIEINSSAEEEVKPDQIFLQIELNSKINTDKNALQKIKIIAENAGIDTKKNFETTEIESSIEQIWFGENKVNTVQKFKITASSTKQVYQIFEKMKSVKASEVFVNGFDYSKKEKLKLDLLAKAIKKAKEKAEIMASAIGQKIGKAILISENKGWQERNNYASYGRSYATRESGFGGNARVRGGIADESMDDVPRFENLEYGVEVFVIFELN